MIRFREVVVSGIRARLVVTVSDLLADSDAVVNCAARVAEATDARLRVIHPLGVVGESMRTALFGVPTLQQRIETAARKLSKQVETVLAGADIPREVVLDHKREESVVLDQALSGVADLLVTGSGRIAMMLLPIASLAKVRTPLLFVPRSARVGTPFIIQALSQNVAPDAFLRGQRWLRTLQCVLNDGARVTDSSEFDILLCPDMGANAAASTERAIATLCGALVARDPAIAVALLPAPDDVETHAFAETVLRVLISEARCPVLAVPALPALRAVPGLANTHTTTEPRPGL